MLKSEDVFEELTVYLRGHKISYSFCSNGSEGQLVSQGTTENLQSEPDTDTLIELVLCLWLFLSVFQRESSSTLSTQSLKCSCSGIV